MSLLPTGRTTALIKNEKVAPVLYSAGMLAIGSLLLAGKPRLGEVPKAAHGGDRKRRSRWRRAAQKSRDAADSFAPSNLSDSMGRSLLIGGAALLLTRLLDEAANLYMPTGRT